MPPRPQTNNPRDSLGDLAKEAQVQRDRQLARERREDARAEAQVRRDAARVEAQLAADLREAAREKARMEKEASARKTAEAREEARNRSQTAGAAVNLAGSLPIFGSQAAGLVGAGQKVGSGISQVAAGASEGGMAGAAGAAAGLAAMAGGVTAAATALKQIPEVAAGFVEALNPGVVIVWQQAMRDLTATIGVALQPIIEGATEISRNLASYLLPVMERLQPVIGRLMDVFAQVADVAFKQFAVAADAVMPLVEAFATLAGAFVPVVQVIGDVLGAVTSALAPVIGIVADLFALLAEPVKLVGMLLGALTPVIQLNASVFRVIAEGVRAALGAIINASRSLYASLKPFIEAFARGLATAVTAIIDFVRRITFGLVDLRPKDGPERKSAAGLAAVQNPQFQSFADFGKTVSLAAAKTAGAQGTLGKESKELTDEERRHKETIEELKKIAKAQEDAAKANREIADKTNPAYDPKNNPNQRKPAGR